jgi:hypothetical protein
METHRDEAKVMEHFSRFIAMQLFLVPESARRYYSVSKVVLLLLDSLKRHSSRLSLLEQSFCSLYHVTLNSDVAGLLSSDAAACGIIVDSIELLVLSSV